MYDFFHDPYVGHGPKRFKGIPEKEDVVKKAAMNEPESLEEQAAQEGYVPELTKEEHAIEFGYPVPEYEPDEEPADDFPDGFNDVQDPGEEYDEDYDVSDPYDKEYDVP